MAARRRVLIRCIFASSSIGSEAVKDCLVTDSLKATPPAAGETQWSPESASVSS